MPTIRVLARAGGTELGRWEWPSDGVDEATAVLGRLDEDESLAFELTPGVREEPWHLYAGDTLLGEEDSEKPDRVLEDGAWKWRSATFLESARGPVMLRFVPDEATPESGSRLCLRVTVVPNKVGEEGYSRLVRDLSTLGRGLILDLLSKSRIGLALSLQEHLPTPRSALEELTALSEIAAALEWQTRAIARDPAKTLCRETRLSEVRGSERIARSGMRELASRGLSPRRALGLAVGVTTLCERGVESVDTPEHRVIKGAVSEIMQRIRRCRRLIEGETHCIEADRPYRERPPVESSLWVIQDEPRLRELEAEDAKAKHILDSLRRISAAFPLALSRPSSQKPNSPVFLHVPAYRRIRHSIVRLRRGDTALYDDGLSVRTAATSELYERWVFLQVVASLFDLGFVSLDQAGLASLVAMRYRLMLEKEGHILFAAKRSGQSGGPAVVRVEYEPFIHVREEAARRKARVFAESGSRLSNALRPDVLLSFHRPTRYGRDNTWDDAVVFDAKYSRRVDGKISEAWNKYARIRRSSDGKGIVRGVFLVAPETISPSKSVGTLGIRFTDPAFRVAEWRDETQPMGAVRLFPCEEADGGGPDTLAARENTAAPRVRSMRSIRVAMEQVVTGLGYEAIAAGMWEEKVRALKPGFAGTVSSPSLGKAG